MRTSWVLVAFALVSSVQAISRSEEKLQNTGGFHLIRDMILGRHSQKYHERHQPLSGLTVIGAGFPRTGTKSIEAALTSVGHRIYDIRSIVENQHADRWVQAAKDWKTKDDLSGVENLLQEMEAMGYTATLDTPIFLFAEPLAQLRPQAKVLLSVRDTPEKWHTSVLYIAVFISTLMYCRPWVWFIPDFTFIDTLLEIIVGDEGGYEKVPMRSNPDYLSRPLPWYEFFHLHPMETPEIRERTIAFHKNHQAKLEELLAEDRLLVFNVKQGWEPLALFLGIDDDELTSQAFPYLNERNTLEMVEKLLHVFAIGFPLWILFLLAILAWGLRTFYRLLRSCRSHNKVKLN